MSWHFSFTALTTEEAHSKGAKAVADAEPHCPSEVISALDKLISLMPAKSEKPIVVLSYGHIDGNGGNALIEVKIAP